MNDFLNIGNFRGIHRIDSITQIIKRSNEIAIPFFQRPVKNLKAAMPCDNLKDTFSSSASGQDLIVRVNRFSVGVKKAVKRRTEPHGPTSRPSAMSNIVGSSEARNKALRII